MGCSRDVSQAALGRTPCPAGSEPPRPGAGVFSGCAGCTPGQDPSLGKPQVASTPGAHQPLGGDYRTKGLGGQEGVTRSCSIHPNTGGRRGDVPHQQQQVEVGCCKPSPVHSPPELTGRMREALPCTWPRLSLVPPQGAGGRPEGAAGPSEQPSHPPGSQAEKTSP